MAVAVLGLGRFGSQLVRDLTDAGIDVLAVDHVDVLVNDLADVATLAAQGDLTDHDFLRSLTLEEYETVVVAIGAEMATSVLVTLVLKKELLLPHVVAKASTTHHAVALRLAGADIVLSPEQEAATRLARTLGSRHVGDYLSLGRSHGVAIIEAPVWTEGKPLASARLAESKVALLARMRGDEVQFNPALDEIVQRGDCWLVAGHDDNLRKLDPK